MGRQVDYNSDTLAPFIEELCRPIQINFNSSNLSDTELADRLNFVPQNIFLDFDYNFDQFFIKDEKM